MDLENALETAIGLRDAMPEETASARVERHLLRNLDSNGLFARAAQRAAFPADVASLERSLATALARAAGSSGSRGSRWTGSPRSPPRRQPGWPTCSPRRARWRAP